MDFHRTVHSAAHSFFGVRNVSSARRHHSKHEFLFIRVVFMVDKNDNWHINSNHEQKHSCIELKCWWVWASKTKSERILISTMTALILERVAFATNKHDAYASICSDAHSNHKLSIFVHINKSSEFRLCVACRATNTFARTRTHECVAKPQHLLSIWNPIPVNFFSVYDSRESERISCKPPESKPQRLNDLRKQREKGIS